MPNAGPRTSEELAAVAARQAERKRAEEAAHAEAVARIPADTKYKYEFPLSSHTTDKRLLKYSTLFQKLYHYILRQKLVPPETSTFATIKDKFGMKYATFKQYLSQVGPEIVDPVEQKCIYTIFMIMYNVPPGAHDGAQFPPTEYPDVPVNMENDPTTKYPPPYKIPGYIFESGIDSAIRFIRYIMEHTTNENIVGKSIQEAYKYIAYVKQSISSMPESVSEPHQLQWLRRILNNPSLTVNDIHNVIVAKNWYRVEAVIDNYILHDYDRNMRRFFAVIIPNWIDFLYFLDNGTFYTGNVFSSNPLIGSTGADNFQKLSNRNQQVFVAVHSSVDPEKNNIWTIGTKIADTAWVKFNFDLKIPTVTETEKSPLPPGYVNIAKFQGYRFMDMPPPLILKAFAHGPPIAMAPHVKELFPEWTRADTLAAWLDKVMAKWRADISRMAADLQQKLCIGGAVNDNIWHLRDVPTIQLDLYDDVLAYIATQRGVPVEILRRQYEMTVAASGPKAPQGGGAVKTKKSAKSKRMPRRNRKQTRRQRGGAATGMPLAYFQDGAQMRGTYDAPTGVGLAGSTNTMARTAIAQTGGKRSKQNGGFLPSVMGQMVQNGAYLSPLASFMGYKLLKSGRKSTHRKRRTRRN